MFKFTVYVFDVIVFVSPLFTIPKVPSPKFIFEKLEIKFWLFPASITPVELLDKLISPCKIEFPLAEYIPIDLLPTSILELVSVKIL